MRASADLIAEKLWFGTASLGLPDYGHPVSEFRSDPERMLEHLYNRGFRQFDTAASYGYAERSVASLVCQHEDCVVATKVGSEFNPEMACTLDIMIRELERSLSLLSKIDILYLHKSTPEVLSDERLFSHLDEYIQSGDIKKIGASVYGESELLQAIQHPQIDVIQVAGCILDWSLLQLGSRVLRKKIVCRSVFLQGLLAKGRSEIYDLPDKSVFVERLELITALSTKLGVNNGQLSLWFVLRLLGDVDVVIGSRSIDSVNENLAILDREFDASLFNEVMKYGDSSYDFMNPRLWEKN